MSQGPFILIVEDDDAIRLTLRDYLQRKGHAVQVASDGVGALRIMVDHPVELMVTDYRMELFGGDYWMRFLSRFCPDLKVIVMSGYIDEDIAVPYPTLMKPVDYTELESLIRRELGRE